jgi:hypothetical protein
METETKQKPIELRSIPESQEERTQILSSCPRLIIRVAARCRASKSSVSKVWNLQAGVSPYSRPRSARIAKALLNEVNRNLAKQQS